MFLPATDISHVCHPRASGGLVFRGMGKFFNLKSLAFKTAALLLVCVLYATPAYACTNPAGAKGDIIYNADHNVPQYCDDTNWVPFPKKSTSVDTNPCRPAASPTPGTVCNDGTIYAGTSPDGNVPMYIHPTDASTSIPWNNGTANYVNTGATNATTGAANTATLVVASDAGAPYLAARLCNDLVSNDRTDWYLGSENEMDVLVTNRVTLGFPSAFYWSSREPGTGMFSQAFNMGFTGGGTALSNKDSNSRVRCVRKGYQPACANPPGVAGSMLYNSDDNVLQWCNGTEWVAAGPVPGAGGSGCSNPSGIAGDLISNNDYDIAQYCDGTNWVRIGDPCNKNITPANATFCADGSVFVQVIGSNKVYTTRCDLGMTWDGTTCTGTRTLLPWNNGNITGGVAVGTVAAMDGSTDNALLVSIDSDSITGGFQPHQAAVACDNLTEYGYDDWYLPSRDEIGALATHRVAIGGFTNGFYWGVRDNSQTNTALGYLFPTGPHTSRVKSDNHPVRCVRHD